VVMDQLILFHKPNKKMSSEKKIDHFIPQTKHTRVYLDPSLLLNEVRFFNTVEL
jgi:hypothetical protein